MARFIATAAAATLLVLFAAAATSAQPITVTVAQPPAWTRNKTEWRSRLYNSLRLTPAQVGALETVLDARDALRAPLKNASWTLARAAATAERAKPRNATLEQALVKPLLSLENSTVVAVTRAKENALNATEIKLRAAATAVASAGASAGGAAPVATVAAALIAKALNLTADAVDRHLQDMLTVEQYRAAARRSKVQAAELSSAEEQAAFATLGSFAESTAPVTTTPAPISAPASAEASAAASAAAATLSPKDTAAAAFLEAAAALPKRESYPATSTTPVRELEGSSPPATIFAKVGGRAPSSAPAVPHPASLVDASDAAIASWLSERPAQADSADQREHLGKVAAWVAAAEELSFNDESADAEISSSSSIYAAEAEAALAGVAYSDAAPEGGVTSPEVAAEAEAAAEEARPAALELPASLSASARAFFRRQAPDGTISRSTPGGLGPSGKPIVAVGAPTYPATSLDAMAIQATPAIKDYYRYLALRCMGFSKTLAATAVAATEDRSLSTAVKYCLTSLKIELAGGAEPVWVGQAATPYVIPQTGTVNSFAAQNGQQGGKRRSRSLFAAEAPAAPTKEGTSASAATADEAAPAAPVSASSSSSSTPSSATTTRKLFNFGTNTSPPPPPSPPPPGPTPGPPGPSPSPPPPAFGTYASFRADTTALSASKNGGLSVEPPDGGLCAGAGYIMSMENNVASVRTQADPATAVRSVSLFTFFQGSSGDGFGDPHCLYHAPSGRFFAVAYQTTSTAATFIPLAVSAVNDPLGTWTVYRINSWNNVAAGLSNCNAQTPCFGDYPQIGANADSIWITSNQFPQSGSQLLNFAGTLITAFAVSNLVAGGTQTPFQTGTTALFSVKPIVVSGPTANYPSGTMYLLTTQTSTTLRLLTYTNTGNLASSSAPTLASQRTISSSISVGGDFNYGSSAQLANGQNIDGGDDRLIGLSFASGRLLASCTSYYGSTAATPKLAVAYWFIDVASATQVYAGLYADASWNAWTMSTVLDPNNVNRGFAAGMIATYPGNTVAFPTASVLATLQVNSGASDSAALVSAQDGQYLRGFTNPLRSGDYSTSVLDPATGVAWLLSEQGQTYSTTGSNNWGTVVWKASFT